MNKGRTMKKLIPVAALVLLPAAYVGSYYAMLRPIPVMGNLLPGAHTHMPSYRFHWGLPRYWNSYWGSVYTPMHLLDKKIRPQFWFVPDAPPQHPSQKGGERP